MLHFIPLVATQAADAVSGGIAHGPRRGAKLFNDGRIGGMCGLIGFFNGCDLAVACPKALLRRACRPDAEGIDPFRTWDARSTVRRQGPRHTNMADQVFPEAFTPLLRSVRLQGASAAQRHGLQRSALFRFLNFTHKLELLVVNTVTANIALGRYDLFLPRRIRLGAHKLYVDEGYHALAAFEAMAVLQQSDGPGLLTEAPPPFLSAIRDGLEFGNDMRRRYLGELFFVIASEMLISSTLHDAQAQAGMGGPIREMLRDHAMDEARHHAFYRDVLDTIWDQLDRDDQHHLAAMMPDLVAGYCQPDRPALRADLRWLGLAPHEIEDVLDEIHSPRSTAAYALQVGAPLFLRVAEISAPAVREHLDAALHAAAA